MAEVLLRIEGVNFDAALLDTTDISTVRGASFLYLEAVRAVQAALTEGCLGKDVTDCQRLSAGGSVGLFWLTLADDETLEQAVKRHQRVRDTVEEWLSGYPPRELKDKQASEVFALCRHLSFVVDVVEVSAGEPEKKPELWENERVPPFLRDRERVIAANRLRQMRSPSVVVPAWKATEDHGWQICSEDQVRAAKKDKKRYKGDDRWVSRAVWARRIYGQGRKRDSYREALKPTDFDRDELEVPKSYYDYTWDFAQLADDGSIGANLQGKIAVFYADGNSFSAVQDRMVRPGGPALQQQFDEQLHGHRRKLLHALLNVLSARKPALRTAEAETQEEKERRPDGEDRPTLRLETLYSAGDEGMWVVPASMGWTLASTFFAQVCGLDIETGERNRKGWTIGERGKEERLHVAAGLVFCHHTAPITRVRRIAVELAELAKAHDRGRSLLCYQVLESFDHIGRDVAAFRKERCPRGTAPGDFMLPGDRLWQVPRALQEIKEKELLPRRQLKRLALALHGGGTGSRYAEALKRLESECPELEDHLPALRACFGEGPALWLHLDELWDFLVVPEKTKVLEEECASGG